MNCLVNCPFELFSTSTIKSNPSRLTAVGSFSRSFLHPSCLKTSGQSAVSGHQSMSCVSPGPVQHWPRLSRPPGVIWSRWSRSKAEGATSWTLASGGTCLEKTPCKVRLDLHLQEPSSGQASVPSNVLLSSVDVDTNQVPVPSWTCCGPKTDSDCSTSATPPPSLTPRWPAKPHQPQQCYLPIASPQCPLVSSRRRWPCGEMPRAARKPSDRLRRSQANKRATSCT